MDFQQKMQQLVDYKKVSLSEFADLLEIQRSTLSHLFSGRNKPGWEFLQKLATAFPEINLNWLIGAEQEMLKSDAVKNGPAPAPLNALASTRKVVRLLLVYDDGSFGQFDPAKEV